MHLLNSILSSLTPTSTTAAGRDAMPGGEAGAEGGFSDLLSLFTANTDGADAAGSATEAGDQPHLAAPALATPAEPLRDGMAATPRSTAWLAADRAAAADQGTLVSGSAMPPVAASGKILPVSLPVAAPRTEGNPQGPMVNAVVTDDAVEAGVALAAVEMEIAPVVVATEMEVAPVAAVVEVETAPAPAADEGEPDDGADAAPAPAPASAIIPAPVPVGTLIAATPPAMPAVGITPVPATDAGNDVEPADTAVKHQTAADGAAQRLAPLPETVPIVAERAADGDPDADEPSAKPGEEASPARLARLANDAVAQINLPIVQAAMSQPGAEQAGIVAQAADGEASAPAVATLRTAPVMERWAARQGDAQPRAQHPVSAPAEAAPASADAPALTLRMAQDADAAAPASDRRETMAEGRAAPAPRLAATAEREIERPRMAASTATASGTTSTTAPSFSATTPALAVDSAPVTTSLRAQGHEQMADLAQIVDRLAAAREALAPAKAALSIDHAEFGELTLRFDQGQDGRLTAELAGANAETHRAVAHALAAERGQTGQGDGSPASQQQQQSAGQSLRSSTGDREAGGNGANGDQRQDSTRQRADRGQRQQAQAGGPQRDGVFA